MRNSVIFASPLDPILLPTLVWSPQINVPLVWKLRTEENGQHSTGPGALQSWIIFPSIYCQRAAHEDARQQQNKAVREMNLEGM